MLSMAWKNSYRLTGVIIWGQCKPSSSQWVCSTLKLHLGLPPYLLWFPLGVPFNSLYFPPFIASLSPSALCCYFPLYFIIISFITSCLHGFYRPLGLL